MNFAALLAVVAAAAFALPLVVRGGVALGASRGAGVLVSLGLASLLVVVWVLAQRTDPDTGRDPAVVPEVASGDSAGSSTSAARSHAARAGEVEEAVDASV